MTANMKTKRTLVGVVVSDKMDKTVVVEVSRTLQDPQLNKVVKKRKKYKVHDEKEVASVGDRVEIYQGRPVSKDKYMYLERVLDAGMTKKSKAK